MSKKAIYWIVGVIVIVIIVIIAVTSGKSAPATSSASQTTSQATSSATLSGSTPQPDQANQTAAGAVRQTIHDLISSGATETCTFSIPATTNTSSLSGIVYMASSNMRGDFTKTDTADKVSSSHMIIANGTVYLWSDALSKGVKLLWSLAASSTALLGKAGGINFDQPTTYSCTNQAPEQSQFTLPANITFMDISAMIKSGRLPTGSVSR